MAFWLVKTEPDTYSVEDFAAEKVTLWDRVRNYQARNYLRAMKLGDRVLVYHSGVEPPGVAGIARVAGEAVPDPSQFDPQSEYFDEKASAQAPRWFAPKLQLEKKFRELVPLASLRDQPALEKMVLLRRGSRLSVLPVSDREFNVIVGLAC